MYKRLLNIPEDRRKSFFLFGPRGTGKTSWVRHVFEKHLYLDLLDADVYFSLRAQPKRLSHFIPKGYQGWIIIDEVQKIPALLDEVHRLIEQEKYCFILTGSSARSLKRHGSNLLAGRALTYTMHPLTTIELGSDFDLKKSLQYGHLPAIFSESDPEHFLKTYVKTYLREEVQQEGLTRNLEGFYRFLEIASFSQGSLLNLSAVARECGVSQKIVTDYFLILEDLLLAFRLPIFTKRAKRRLVSHPKFYYFDVGVYRVLRPKGPLDIPEEIGGIALESLFLQELRAINDYYQLYYQLFFWRTSYGMEVDFIAYGDKGFYAFEIKSRLYVDNKDVKGLNAFAELYPEAQLYLLYTGSERLYIGNVKVLPMQLALLHLPEILAGTFV